MVLRVSMLAMVLVGCGAESIPPRAVPAADWAPLELEVREIAKPSCGSCHTRGLRTAKRDALAVFDLRDEHWSRGLGADQLDFFLDRIAGDVTPTERATVVRFVAGAKARRGGGATGAE
jgi:hypothetical protein